MSDIVAVKHRLFVELVYKKTYKRGIEWRVNDAHQLYTTIAGRLLFVTMEMNPYQEEIVTFTIYDEAGNKAEQFTDEALSFDSSKPKDFDSWYVIASAIYQIGKRQASGADDALDAMIQELDDDVPF